MIVRFLMGVGEGTTFPALSVLLAAWTPQSDRAKIGSFVYSGVQVCVWSFKNKKIENKNRTHTFAIKSSGVI